MTSLTPPVIRRNAQTVDGNRLVHHQSYLLLWGEQRDEVLHTLCVWQTGILIRILAHSTTLVGNGFHCEGTERDTVHVAQVYATVLYARWLDRIQRYQHLCLLTRHDGLGGIDGLDAVASTHELSDGNRSLGSVLQDEGVAHGTCSRIDGTEVPFVCVEGYRTLLTLSPNRRCQQQRKNSDNCFSFHDCLYENLNNCLQKYNFLMTKSNDLELFCIFAEILLLNYY